MSRDLETIATIVDELEGTTERRFGKRFVRSTAYKRAREHLGDWPGVLDGVDSRIMSAEEFSDRMDRRKSLALRDFDSSGAFEVATQDVVQDNLAAFVPGLVETQPVDTDPVDVVDESATDPGTLGLDPQDDPSTDAVFREIDLTYSSTEKRLVRWAVGTHVNEAALEDQRLAERFVDRVATSLVERALEDDILNGDGTSASGRKRLDGILANASIGTYDRDTANGEPRLDALAEGVRQVRDGGNYGRLVGVASPTTIKGIRTEKDSDGDHLAEAFDAVVPEIDQLVPSEFIADGTVLLGDFDSGSTVYLRNGFRLQFSDSHDSHFAKGWIAARMRSRVLHHVAKPSAYCEITSM